MHIRGLVEDGIPVPKSPSSASFVVSQDVKQGLTLLFFVYYPVHHTNPVLSPKSRSAKPDVPVFWALLVIASRFRLPNSTKQAHFTLFKMPCSARNRYYEVILMVMFFNGGFLCPGGEFFGNIQ
jgi:hypothetical protein